MVISVRDWAAGCIPVGSDGSDLGVHKHHVWQSVMCFQASVCAENIASST
jgi:hypothetical protein